MPKLLHRSLLAACLAAALLPAGAKDLTVSAAASLKDAFQDIAKAYEQQHRGVSIKLNTAGSGALVQQLLQGAPADVLATADQQSMDMAAEKNGIVRTSRRTFVRNDLVIVVPQAGSHPVRSLKDLQKPEIDRIAISHPDSVPVGRYSKAALEKAGLFRQLKPKVISTQNVRQSLDYVARGEVDAGFVYRTDAALMPGKVRVTHTVALDKPVTYPIAVTANSSDKAEAQRFVNFVTSAQGRQILNRYGFGKP
ncbi:molybdate transport system substrate-binding protein [Neisseria sp. HSC-16F19]|nr:molybdate ABC transporter substrate-binding protein [Neisseria sp. HSC-16F19]MCP2040677.1 molybdate transport system substrate-binding protein [Neisseria sp. HSC-16F19]